MGIRCEISTNFAQRLETISTASGYTTDVKKVYYGADGEKIPMGLNLRSDQLPAIFVIQGVDNTSDRELGGCVNGNWEHELQLWHCGDASDCDMNDFETDVYKAIYANSATAKTDSNSRAIHPKIVRVNPDRIVPDLNMIEAARVSCLFFRIEYKARLFDL